MSPLKPPAGAWDHVRGGLQVPIMILEYGDYQCPYCAAAQPVVAQVLSELGDRASFALRPFQISQVHPRALRAAQAAEAAGEQGNFWSMHKALFQDQTALEDDDLVRRARHLGLDIDRFRSDMDGAHGTAKIRGDFASGVRSGVSGTPTFFVNGVRHDGAADVPSLLEASRRADTFSGIRCPRAGPWA